MISGTPSPVMSYISKQLIAAWKHKTIYVSTQIFTKILKKLSMQENLVWERMQPGNGITSKFVVIGVSPYVTASIPEEPEIE